jgi:hypothetical protein
MSPQMHTKEINLVLCYTIFLSFLYDSPWRIETHSNIQCDAAI